jgi:hypothetical protein
MLHPITHLSRVIIAMPVTHITMTFAALIKQRQLMMPLLRQHMKLHTKTQASIHVGQRVISRAVNVRHMDALVTVMMPLPLIVPTRRQYS